VSPRADGGGAMPDLNDWECRDAARRKISISEEDSWVLVRWLRVGLLRKET